MVSIKPLMNISTLSITAVTVSAEIAAKDFGSGTGHFMSMSGKFPDSAPIPLENIEDVIDQSLIMYFHCWKTLIAGQFATGVIAGTAATNSEGKIKFGAKEILEKADKRLEKIKKFLRNNCESSDKESAVNESSS